MDTDKTTTADGAVAPSEALPEAEATGLAAPTPETGAAATEPGVLAGSGPVLLGVVERPEGAQALVRFGTGEVSMVAPGSHTPAGQVVAIGQGQLVLSGLLGQRVLTMPTG